jgi:hypothetical protein
MTAIHTNASPPTTPPAIAPAFDFPLSLELLGGFVLEVLEVLGLEADVLVLDPVELGAVDSGTSPVSCAEVGLNVEFLDGYAWNAHWGTAVPEGIGFGYAVYTVEQFVLQSDHVRYWVAP